MTVCAQATMIREDDLKKNRHVRDTSATVTTSARQVSESNTITEDSRASKNPHHSHAKSNVHKGQGHGPGPGPVTAPTTASATMSQEEIDLMIRKMSSLKPGAKKENSDTNPDKSPPEAPEPKQEPSQAELQPSPPPASPSKSQSKPPDSHAGPAPVLVSSPASKPSAESLLMSSSDSSGATPVQQGESTPQSPHKFDIASVEDNPFAEEITDKAPVKLQPPKETPQPAAAQATTTPPSPSPATTPASAPKTSPPVQAPTPEPVPPPSTQPPAAQAGTSAASPSEIQPPNPIAVSMPPQGDIEAELSTADTSISDSLKSAGEKIDSLKKEISTLHESSDNMRRMYIDGFITKSAYDKTSENIDHSIRRDKENISIETEREVMDALKRRIDREISVALKVNLLDEDSGDIETDLDRARKLLEYKVIDEGTYNELKSKILSRMDHGKSLIRDVNSVIDGNFNRYVESFADHAPEKKPDPADNPVKASQDSPAPPVTETKKEATEVIAPVPAKRQKDLKSRIKGIFTIRKKESAETDNLDSIKASEELEKVRNMESKRDAIIEARFLLKKEIQKKLGFEDELTYPLLAGRLEKLDTDPEFRSALIDFFRRTSEAEYKGFIKEDEFTAIYTDVARFMQKISAMNLRPVSTPDQKKPEKSK